VPCPRVAAVQVNRDTLPQARQLAVLMQTAHCDVFTANKNLQSYIQCHTSKSRRCRSARSLSSCCLLPLPPPPLLNGPPPEALLPPPPKRGVLPAEASTDAD